MIKLRNIKVIKKVIKIKVIIIKVIKIKVIKINVFKIKVIKLKVTKIKVIKIQIYSNPCDFYHIDLSQLDQFDQLYLFRFFLL